MTTNPQGRRETFLERAFEHYQGLPHQKDAIAKLDGMLPPHTLRVFEKAFSPHRAEEPDPLAPIKLDVPFWHQLDNLRQPHRTCNPSACAMAAHFMLPEAISEDDELIEDFVREGEDFTNHQAMTRILRARGVESFFKYDLDRPKLDHEIRHGRPMVLGVLHRGTRNAPYGGHMIVAVGLNPRADAVICHDPYGSMNDGYRSSPMSGRFVEYSWDELAPRWICEGPGSGWGRLFFPR